MLESLIELFLVGLFIWSIFCIIGQKSNNKNMLLGIGLILFGVIFVFDPEGLASNYKLGGYLFSTLGLISMLLGASKNEEY